MNIAGTIRKSMLAIVYVAAMASSLMGAPTDKPKITDTLNDFNPEYPIGIFVQEIVSNQVGSAVILTNGVLSVGSETIKIAQPSHDVVETNVVSGTLVITTNTYYIVYEDGLAKTLKAYATNEKITSIVTNDIGEVTTNWTKVAYLSDIPPAEKKADKMMQTWEFLEPNMDVVLSMTPNTNAPFAYWKWAGDKEAFQSIALYYKEGSWHVSQNGGAFISTEGDFTNNVVEVGGFTFIATNRAEVMVVYSDQLEDVVIGKLDQYVTNTVNNLIASATNDPTIVRGEKLDAPPDVWGISVSRALTANWAEEADRAGTAESVLSVPWDRVKDTPTSLSGYGITDAVPSSRMVNGKPLTSDITLSASDLGAATADGLVAATTNVVHGDYADADRAAFPNGLGLKAGDGTDKGYVGLRLRNLEGHGLEVVGTRVASIAGQPRIVPYTLFQLTDAGIRFPKAGLGDTVQSSDFTFLYWDAFSRANHVLDYMPSSGTANYEGYPISGKAFLEYFWGLGDLPAKAKASVTVHAASNLVGTTGAPMGVSDIIGSAVKESVLAVTSDVPVYAYSSAWTSDWPADDSAQPSQPQWADGTWSVYLVEGGQTLPGAYSVEGPEDATTLTIDIAGFPTVFTRESTVSGYVNVHGFARMGDVDSKIASATNGLLRTESDPMFTAWTNGTATLSGAFVQGAGFKSAFGSTPIVASGARSHAQGYATGAYGDNSHAEGSHTVASNENSHAEGEYTKALGRGSHAEGSHAVASNDYSHAEGEYTVAGGRLSNAGGSYSRAWGDTSRAWGIGATANAAMSVSEGNQTQANGWYSTARGYWTAANGVMSHAEGVNATAEGNPIFSPEDVSDLSDLLATYTWSAVYKGEDTNSNYRSHGPGTYNINPSGGLAGFYVGETNLQTLLGEKASTGDVQAAISAVNPTFSNAVLAVGLNIDTNSVAVLNEIASTFGDFPIEGTATTVGGLLAALAAAIAWLRRNKANKTDLEGFATEADLLAFYYPDGGITSMDQITTSGIEYAVGSDGGAYVVKGEGLTGHVVLPWKVTIGGNEYKVTAIGESAFSENSFTGLTAPTTIRTIGNSAFYSCISLTSVNLPSVTSIGNTAFENCSSLTSINLPSVTSTGSFAFSYCHSLTSINLPSATSIGGNTFYGCDFIKSVSLPSATTINSGAFDSCSSLESVSIPSATSIGRYAFNECRSLTTIDFGTSPKSAVPSLSDFVFEGVPTSCKFIIPIGMYDEWISASMWSNLYIQGYKFEGYASTAQLANKADKTALDELAAKVDAANAALEEVA